MKVEIFVTPTTDVEEIASALPKHAETSQVNADEKNGVVTVEVAGNEIPDGLIAWIEQQKELGKVERVETI